MIGDARVAGGILWIDIGAAVGNWRLLEARARPAECAAVVKADAYGLGADRLVPAFYAADCRTFFVAGIDEGIAVSQLLANLRDPLRPKDSTIYVLNGLVPGSEGDLVAHDLQPVLNSLADLERWSAYARSLERPLAAALHLDTGMARLGLPAAELAELAANPGRLRTVSITLIMSHLVCADEPAHPLNASQLALFREALPKLPTARASIANSGGIFLGPAYHGQLVRPGVALYGGSPRSAEASPMQPVIRLDARILQVREIDAGNSVGYGATHISPRQQRIATVGVGYADGLFRSLSNRGSGYIGEYAVPLVGRVSMDLTTFDVTDVPEPLARPGAFIELIGPHQPIDAIAHDAGTIAYEVLTALGRRYHRVYSGGGR